MCGIVTSGDLNKYLIDCFVESMPNVILMKDIFILFYLNYNCTHSTSTKMSQIKNKKNYCALSVSVGNERFHVLIGLYKG